MTVEFRILGPLEIDCHGVPLLLSSARERRLLAVLLLSRNRMLPLGNLIDAVWDDHPPASAKRQVQNRLSALRRRLHKTGVEALIVADGPGYRIRIGAEQLDAGRFQILVDRARGLAPDRGPEAAELLREALALWRGPALAGLTGRAIQAGAVRLDEQRLTTYERYVDLQLEHGHHTELIGELHEFVTSHPLRERLVGQLMLALHRADRQAEALQTYDQLRARLADDLGVDPSAQLQRLHTAILRNEPTATGPYDGVRAQAGSAATAPGGPPAQAGDLGPRHLPAVARRFVGRTHEVAVLESGRAVRSVPDVPVPAHLPPDVRGFAGRVRELETLDAVAFDCGEQPTAVVIAAVAGTAGIGKTALAVHWAHRVAENFPDGQLYVNLRGFDASGTVLDPADAVRILLEGLHVPVSLMPTTLEAQVGLYRSLLAEKRMLVLLDNARDADQVRPLLPGAPGCVAVVTSRDRLASLVAAEGAHRVTLDLLTDAEARHLLARRLGRQVLETQAEAVDDIIESCERLPLALAIVAAHAADRTGIRIADLADQLRRTRGSLDAFVVGDPRIDLRAVFSWSYESLSPAAARMFRLLGLHAGPDFSIPAAASLAGVAVDRARLALAELARAHLVVGQPVGRFTLHDLLWAYAAELAHGIDSAAERSEAQRRLLDHYLHTAYAAAMLLRPGRPSATLASRYPGVAPEKLTGRDEAEAWFAAERDVLLMSVRRAAEQGYAAHAWQLVWALEDVLEWRGHWRELATAARVALDVTVRLGDQRGQSEAHNGLARALWRLGEHDEAQAHVERAAALFGEIGDRVRQAAMLRNICLLYHQQGRNLEALAYAERALRLLPADASTAEQAHLLNNLGWLHAQLGNYRQALTYCDQAMANQLALNDPVFMGAIIDTLGYIHHHLGDHDEAIAWYERALESYRGAQDLYRGRTLIRLGDVQRAADMPEAAARSWRQALDMFSNVDPATADSLRERLRTVDMLAE